MDVLLVEDSVGDLMLIRQALSRERFPIRVRVAVDGQQARDIITAGQFKPDLIILDLNLPKISGLSFLEHCHTDASVVVFTALTSPSNELRSFELGAKDYVQKPTDLGEFVQRVSEIVRTWGGPEPAMAG